MEKSIDKKIPTIGILIFEGVIINEVVAPLDVFSNYSAENEALFNVITIGKESKQYKSAHGLKITPDFTIDAVPNLKVLVVPSSYTPSNQTSDKELVEFIKEQNKTADYIASHCAGAFLIGETGIADDKEIVTYVTGGEQLKLEYPNLKVANDDVVSVVQDGKFISSNGSLVSYIASFDLLEKLTNKEHRKFVETSILFDRIKN
jgi:transcriptional regulator GlxA family with amidase domain